MVKKRKMAPSFLPDPPAHPWTPPGPPLDPHFLAWISPAHTPLTLAALQEKVWKPWKTLGLGAFANAMSMPWPRNHTPNMQAYPDADRRKNNHLNSSGKFVDREKLQLPMHPNLLSDQKAERRKKEFRKLNPKRRSW